MHFMPLSFLVSQGADVTSRPCWKLLLVRTQIYLVHRAVSDSIITNRCFEHLREGICDSPQRNELSPSSLCISDYRYTFGQKHRFFLQQSQEFLGLCCVTRMQLPCNWFPEQSLSLIDTLVCGFSTPSHPASHWTGVTL